jgi:hypothetical protein
MRVNHAWLTPLMVTAGGVALQRSAYGARPLMYAA